MTTANEERVSEAGTIVGLEARLVDDLKILRAAFDAAGISFDPQLHVEEAAVPAVVD